MYLADAAIGSVDGKGERETMAEGMEEDGVVGWEEGCRGWWTHERKEREGTSGSVQGEEGDVDMEVT